MNKSSIDEHLKTNYGGLNYGNWKIVVCVSSRTNVRSKMKRVGGISSGCAFTIRQGTLTSQVRCVFFFLSFLTRVWMGLRDRVSQGNTQGHQQRQNQHTKNNPTGKSSFSFSGSDESAHNATAMPRRIQKTGRKWLMSWPTLNALCSRNLITMAVVSVHVCMNITNTFQWDVTFNKLRRTSLTSFFVFGRTGGNSNKHKF